MIGVSNALTHQHVTDLSQVAGERRRRGVSFGVLVPLRGIAAAEKALDSKLGWNVAC